MVERVPTGIEGFDILIEGGIPRGDVILLTGNAGTGKTTFAAQYLYHGLANLNEPGIYVSFAENSEAFLRNMKRLNMDFEKYEKDGRFKFMDLFTVIGTVTGVDRVLTNIVSEIGALKAKRVVLDSFTAFAQAFSEKIDSRMVLYTVIGRISRQSKATALLISEKSGSDLLSEKVEEFVADGVVVLTHSPESGHLGRRLQIVKMRGTNTSRAQLRYEIGKHGIRVYPELELRHVEKASAERVSSGIDGLDKMLNGGFFKGSTTMLAGPSGTGKTTAALHFIVQGATRNERGLFISFEQSAAQLVKHGQGFGWNMNAFVDSGMVRIASYHPELYKLEDLNFEIRNLLHEYKPNRLVVDSFDPLERTMSDRERVLLMKSIESYTKEADVTSLFTMVSESSTSITGTAISTLVDSIISIRHVEVESVLKRCLVVFKARNTVHDHDIREFEITERGIVLKEKLAGVEQILTGAARRTFAEDTFVEVFRKAGKVGR